MSKVNIPMYIVNHCLYFGCEWKLVVDYYLNVTDTWEYESIWGLILYYTPETNTMFDTLMLVKWSCSSIFELLWISDSISSV